MSETVERADRELRSKAAELSANIARPGDWFSSEVAVRLLLANLVSAPVEVFERARSEHWADHGGQRSDDCPCCGYCDAAVYEAKTGRSLASDFLPQVPR